MSPLDYSNAAHRRIGAFTEYWIIGPAPYDRVRVGYQEYNCWGEKKVMGGGKLTTTAKTAKEYISAGKSVPLALMKRGCCPPQLMKEFLETERFASESGDAVEEAAALSKKGYLGGVG